MGANKYGDIKKIVLSSIANNLIFAAALITIGLAFKDVLLGLYVPNNAQVMAAATQRFMVLVIPYFLCGFVEIGSATLRSMGYSVTPAVICLIGSCLFRIVWINTVFKYMRTPECVYISYPISWVITATVMFIFLTIAVKKEIKMQKKCIHLNVHIKKSCNHQKTFKADTHK